MPETDEVELQQELQRFVTQLTDRVAQAAEGLEHSHRVRVRDEALRATLRYVSAAMEIATGPVAEANLLDMLVFVRLCRSTLERHWVPDLYGEDGRELSAVFLHLEGELQALAARVLSTEERQWLEEVVQAWLEAHPGQLRVEGIRLQDFATTAGGGARVGGLMAGFKTATRAANQALSLSERGLFLVHRLPFLWRLQAKLAAHEITTELLLTLFGVEELPLKRWRRDALRILRSTAATATALACGAGLVTWVVARARR